MEWLSRVSANTLAVIFKVKDQANTLAVFSKAKDQACEIFQEIKDYLSKVDSFFTGFRERKTIQRVRDGFNTERLKVIHIARNRIQKIHDNLEQDYMKIVFFGRTSNGKSTVINAMLHDNILPSCMGHTTNSFIEVRGSEEEKATVKPRDSSESKLVENTKDLRVAVSELNEQSHALIEVSWPCSKCKLLQEEIRLLDCPGYNDSSTMDKKLEDVCQDADVFVLVINAVSSLSEHDKAYFKQVSSDLSKPNIFILFNWWDRSSAEEPETQKKVKQQHLDRATEFLTRELEVVKETEVKERIFFVSAHEVLKHRMGEAINDKGFQERKKEFEEFESKVKTCVSETAVKTKFMTRTKRGKDIISELRPELEQLLLTGEEILNEEKGDLNHIAKQFNTSFRDMEKDVQSTVKNVEETVKSTLGTQFAGLDKLVDSFNNKFDPKKLEEYKKELNEFVTVKMNEELQKEVTKCIASFKKRVNIKMLELSNLYQLLSEEQMEQNLPLKGNLQLPPVPTIPADFNVNINVGLSLEKAKLGTLLLTSGTAALTNFAPRALLSALGSTWSGVTVAGLAISTATVMTAGSVVAVGMGIVAGARFVRSTLSNVTLDEKKESCKRRYVEHVKKCEKTFTDQKRTLVCDQIERELSKALKQLDSKTKDPLLQLVNEKTTELDQELGKLSDMKTNFDSLDNRLADLMKPFLQN